MTNMILQPYTKNPLTGADPIKEKNKIRQDQQDCQDISLFRHFQEESD
jgi:hypothetical protein